jgi:amino acid adenylation domain-containing protein
VLDARLRPLPIGVPGELYIGGVCLARGYFNRPGPTAEKFIPDPFSEEPGARLYKTGDRARFRADGNIEFLGRADSQVKIRGFRVEPGEVEAALREQAGVREAVVMARKGPGHGLRLVAYVLGAPGAGVTRGGLREQLKGKLPEYMMPSVFVLLDAFPLTPSGKIDRRALPEPAAADFEAADSYVAPRTPAEELLARLWADVLGLERVGVGDNFFELGGHSLLATQLMSRVRQQFGAELPLRRLFDEPTVEGLARAVEGRPAGDSGPPPVGRAGRALPLPLSYAQQRLWFIHQLAPDSAAYNMPGALRLTGTLNFAALTRSLDEIVRRHEVLRTSFHNDGGRATQIVSPPAPLPVRVVDLSRLPEAAREVESRRLAGEEARRGFDLEAGPMVRAALLRLGPEEHVLLFTMHHIVSDGWSLDVMTRELAALYEAHARGAASPLQELPIQYADFAVWQREHFAGEALEVHLDYWRRRLAGAPPALELPADRPRPAVPSGRGASCSTHLPGRLVQDLSALGRREGTTLFMTLLAAFDVLLARHTGQRDLVVGTPVAGRNRSELEPLIGFFVNMLPLRTDLSGDPSFTELLARVRETALDAYAHQDAPFEQVVEALQPERDTGRPPIFQVTFALHHAAQKELALPGLTWRPLEFEGATTSYDLELHLWESPAGVRCILSYNDDLFERETAERLLERFARLLAAAAAAPEVPVFDLDLLTEGERHMLAAWHDTRRDYGSARCLHQLFEERAALTPWAVALVADEETLTYAELDARANRLARHLLALGLEPEGLVGAYMERSAEMVVALLGILKAGGAYLPLDPSYPRERLAYMLEDAGARLVLTHERLRGLAPGGTATVVDLDSAREAIGRHNASAPSSESAPRATAENLCYVIYTSGSTGRPKGAMVTHGGVVNCLRAMQELHGLGADDGFVFKTPLNFDPSVWEVFWPLWVGGRVVVARPGGHLDPEYLAELIERERVTAAYFVPTMLRAFAESGPAVRAAASLRYVSCGGEKMPAETMRLFSRRFPGVELHHSYGPTETAICSSEWPCDSARGRHRVLIGRPLANMRYHVLDERMRPAPLGALGELYIGGAGVGRGYLGRPGLTAERFVPDPFSNESGARLYRTGDVVRYEADGNVEFVGRVDEQLKLRGYRIEPGEIEAALKSHASVAAAVVLLREVVPGGQQLVAYVAGERPAPAHELRAHLREQLPDYMMPARFVHLAELPLLPSGKVDRKGLPEPAASEAEMTEGSAAPRTPAEDLLAGVFADVLGLERVGVNDNFFELGGHSLLATQLVSRVRALFGVELPLRAVFERPTVGALAEAVAVQSGTPDVPPVAAAERGPGGAAPLSYAQQRLWFMEQFEPGQPVYNIPVAVRMTGELDVEALAESLARVVERHESLRTTFTAREGNPAQIVHATLPVGLEVEDVSAPAADEGEEEVRRRARARASLPFDLEAGPLVRATLYRLGEEDAVLLLVMHHLISDGWSLGVLVRELAAFYEAARRGRPAPLAELPVQYADFALWQREHLRGERLEGHLEYWRRQLDGLPPLELPTDFPRAPRQTYDGAYETFELPAALTEELKALGRREGATLFMTLLAAFQTLLHRHSGQSDFAVGADVASRNRAEVEGLIGFFVNMLVLRARFAGDPTFRDLLRQTRTAALEAYAHQDVPFDKLVEQLHPERSLSTTPLFQVVFVLHNQPMTELETSGLTLAPFDIDTGAVQFDLILSAVEAEGGLACAVGYKIDLFAAETVRRWVGHFRTLLEEIARDPAQRISQLRLLSEAETGGFSPHSFPDAGLSQKEFENLLLEIGGLSKE